jgi:hypothetical protein
LTPVTRPLQLPPGKYTIWRDIVMSLYPEECGQRLIW